MAAGTRSLVSGLRAFRGACFSSLATCLCVAVVVTACDESFDPIAPSDLAFSVFGHLDASADTQWIRVMPIRPLKLASQEALGATVTLEHLGTGQVFELRDSLFTYSSRSDPDLGAEGVYLHNFWTLEDIEPGTGYRFSARREGKDPAEAVVVIPLDYEVEVAINQVRGRWETDELWIAGVKHLPFLSASTNYYDSCGAGVTKVRYDRRSADDETHLIAITRQRPETRQGCSLPWVANRELSIVGSVAEWPSGGYSQPALGEAGLTSNITNAVGFLGGVLTKVIPYEDCTFQSEGAPVPHYCILRYNQETATLTSTVTEPQCFGPLDSVLVHMMELGQDPARIRTALSDGAGEFVIGALEAGIPHFLWVRAPPVPIDSVYDAWAWKWIYTDWEDIHTLHTDTLIFSPGQILEYDINLHRLIPCDEEHLPK